MSHLSHSYFSFLSFSKKNIIFSSYKNTLINKNQIFFNLYTVNHREKLFTEKIPYLAAKNTCVAGFRFFIPTFITYIYVNKQKSTYHYIL